MFASVANALTAEDLESGSLTSSVSISFAPASGNTTLSPTDASGASGLISVLANVGVSNSGGYSVYLGSSSPNLVGRKDSSVVIPGVSGEVSFSDLQDNTWGYYAGEGSFIPEDATYKAVSQGQGDAIFVNNNSAVKNENRIFMLGFAAKISNDVPADTYENQVTLSVLSSPYQLTLMDIDNMQDMTSAICENTPQLSTKQLKDVRDGKYYWVTKLADNNCWMTQNLDLDLSTSVALTPEDSDVETNWVPEFNTATVVADATTSTDDLRHRSWSLGDYRITSPTKDNSCGSEKHTAAECPEQFEAYNIPMIANGDMEAHYILGNHYQWDVATTGADGAIAEKQAASSICAKGWRLPTSANSGEFQRLMDAYSVGDNVPKLTSAPLYFVRGGYVDANTSLFSFAGTTGAYWSSTLQADGDGIYVLDFYGDNNLNSFRISSPNLGLSVRCVAR